MPVTADTITDVQIRELLAGELTPKQIADCELALRKRDRHWTRFERNLQRGARARCAELLNAGATSTLDCDFRDAHDTATDTPAGNKCGAPATHRIEWADGRYSFGCAAHLTIEESASVKPARIIPLEGRASKESP